jgi:hypothetical protein
VRIGVDPKMWTNAKFVWSCGRADVPVFRAKSLRAAKQGRPDVTAARRALQRRQGKFDPRRLFIDETSVSTTITRLYGRAPQGEWLVQKVLHGNWKTVTFIAALRHERVTAPFVLEGAMNGETFKAYSNNSSLRL